MSNIPATCPWCGAAREPQWYEVARWTCDSSQWMASGHLPHQSDTCKLILANREIEKLRAERDAARAEVAELEDCREALRRIGAEVCGCEHVDSADERRMQTWHILEAARVDKEKLRLERGVARREIAERTMTEQNDLPTYLRDLAETPEFDDWDRHVYSAKVCRMAADEIEKLTRELRTARYAARRLYDRLIELGQVAEAREMATSWPWLEEEQGVQNDRKTDS